MSRMKQEFTRAGFAVVIAVVIAISSTACKEEKTPPPQPWTFASESAPYSVTMPPDWSAEDPKVFNSFADFAARKDQLHLIVIPQKLPRLAGAAPPDALALKRAAVSVMEESIDDLQVLKQGPIAIDGLDGHTVFATGKVEGEPHHYITTYTTAGDWGFQIIAWAPSARERALTAEIDGLLESWDFRADGASATADAADDTNDLIDAGR
jgi:hypothetical protein